jgi:hypothetical protein
MNMRKKTPRTLINPRMPRREPFHVGPLLSAAALTLASRRNVVDFLPKPFGCEQLQRRLRDRLAHT